jgi:hypothetical protein
MVIFARTTVARLLLWQLPQNVAPPSGKTKLVNLAKFDQIKQINQINQF